MKLIGRIVCFFKGHRRGKYIREADINGDLYKLYGCPRCGHETRYNKIKDENKGSPGDQA